VNAVGSIFLILGCLVGSAFFSGSETALLRLRQSEVEGEEEARSGPATTAIRELLSSTSRLLVTLLLGNNVANILGASVASALAIAYLGPELGVAVATLAMTVLVLVFCEVLPKAVAAAHPRGVSRTVALPLYLMHQVLRPVHSGFARAIDPVVRRIAGGAADGRVITSEEVLRLARDAEFGERSGGAPAIIAATARANEMTVQEIMVDRPQVVAFPLDTAPTELLDRMLEERYTRVPIYRASIDDLLGLVHFKDLVRHVRSGGTDLERILRPVLRVPERKPILDLLAEMQRGTVHLAIVKDEHGITQGLVTTEDILEELVGEIRDEYDREELQSIRALPEGSFEALGRVKVLDFNRETGWDVPSEPGDTLSGLVFNHLGRSPRRGDRISLPGYEVLVTEVSGTRIGWVRVLRAVEPPPEPEATEQARA
jgi:CBS domain containing-hemolysin-like protein